MTDAEKLRKLNDEREKAEQAFHKAQENLKQKEAAAAKEYDRQRTHRLCERGGHLEKYLEEPELFTDDQVRRLIDYLFSFNGVKTLVRDMLQISRGEAAGSVEEVIEAAIKKVEYKQSGTMPTVTP